MNPARDSNTPFSHGSVAALRRVRPGISIEIRWCAAHVGIAGNEEADKWARLAAEKPGTRGGGTPRPTPAIPHKPQARNLGEEVGGGTPMGWRSDLEDEVPHAKEPETR